MCRAGVGWLSGDCFYILFLSRCVEGRGDEVDKRRTQGGVISTSEERWKKTYEGLRLWLNRGRKKMEKSKNQERLGGERSK